MIKKKENKKKKIFDAEIFLSIIVIVIMIPILSFLVIRAFNSRIYGNLYKTYPGIRAEVNKESYDPGEKIVLAVKNLSKESIYIEPCEYLDNFEEKIDGEWTKIESVKQNKIYDESLFRKNEIAVNCKINPPDPGGLYRVAVKAYYGCEKPGVCDSFNIIYSNEFKIAKE